VTVEIVEVEEVDPEARRHVPDLTGDG